MSILLYFLDLFGGAIVSLPIALVLAFMVSYIDCRNYDDWIRLAVNRVTHSIKML